MKKWHKRTLFVLALGLLGTVAVAYRPALTPDEVQEIKHFEQEVALPEHLSDSTFAFTHTIQLHNPQKGTWYAGGMQEVLKQLTPPSGR